MKYLISSCLLGVDCKYNGGNNFCRELADFLTGKEYVSVCPEVLGGLPIPRACAEIKDGRVINHDHEDVSAAFHYGAFQALAIARKEQVDLAILQSRSPSCGKGKRYSGNFDGILVEGNGIFVQQLEEANIPVMDVEEFLERLHQGQMSE